MAMLRIERSASTPGSHDDLSNARHRQLIGYTGLALPWLLILIVLWRDGWLVWRGLDSVSAYYYTGANALFVGLLFALGLFLASYEGYDNRLQKWDRRFARIAAVAAVSVAFFPTAAPQVEGITPLAWWGPWICCIHIVSAVVLFAVFAVFCLWLFRATEKSTAKPERAREAMPDPNPGKKWRNHFYALWSDDIRLYRLGGLQRSKTQAHFLAGSNGTDLFCSILVGERILAQVDCETTRPHAGGKVCTLSAITYEKCDRRGRYR